MPSSGKAVIVGGKRNHASGYFRGVPKTPTAGVQFWNGVYSGFSPFRYNPNNPYGQRNQSLNFMPTPSRPSYN